MTRLREAYDSLNQTFPLAWSPDELVDAMQTGDRLTYFPGQAAEHIDHFRAILPQAVAKVKDMNKPLSNENVDPNSELVQRKVSEYQERVTRAEAALADISAVP